VDAHALAASGVTPTPAPEGPVAAFDRDNLQSVLSHLRTYEAVPVECARCLRALSHLAYADARAVGECDGVLEQVMRVLAIHPGEHTVGTPAMGALCNMAYNQSVSLKRLADPAVMAVFLDAIASHPGRDVGVKASEAVARVVAASQVDPESEAPAPCEGGGLSALFLAASSGNPPWQEVVPGLIAQLVVNEVVEVVPVAKAFVSAGRQCEPSAASGWLFMAKILSLPDCACHELPQPMVDAGAIGVASALMERCEGDGTTQLTGIEALSSLVGSRWTGLVAFAETGGMQRIEAAMQTHADHEVLQTKGVRALASGIGWPQEIQNKAQYSHSRAIGLTKAAMSQHGGNAELQAAALEGLSKYLSKVKCKEEVTSEGGTGLVKAMMTRHSEEPKVIQWGRKVLSAIGEDPNWAPRAVRE